MHAYICAMNLAYQHFLPADFNDKSRVWVYQCNRLLTISEAMELEEMLQDFVASWKSHGAPIKGYANLFFGQFLILMADESETGVSGCSTDSSVRLVKSIEERFNVSMFDRQLLAFIVKDKVQVLPLSQLPYAIENAFVTPETLYFNNLVKDKHELMHQWIVRAKESWLKTKLQVKNADL